MKVSVLALLLILADSATLKQDTGVNSLQPLEVMVPLLGNILNFMLDSFDRTMIPLVYPESPEASLAELQGCALALWGDLLPQILSSDLEALADTCQDSNRTALLNTIYQDVALGIRNFSNPCLEFFAEYQLGIRRYLDSVIDPVLQSDLGFAVPQPQITIPLDTVVADLQPVPGFLANVNDADQLVERVANLTAAIENLTRDVPDAEATERGEVADVVDTGIAVMLGSGNQFVYAVITQFLNEASILLCPIIAPTQIDSSSSNS